MTFNFLTQKAAALALCSTMIAGYSFADENLGFYAIDRSVEQQILNAAIEETEEVEFNEAEQYSDYLEYSLSNNISDDQNKNPFDGWTFEQNRKFPLLYKEKLGSKTATVPMIVPGVQRGDYFQVAKTLDTSNAERLVLSYSASQGGAEFINALKGCGIYFNASVMSDDHELLKQEHCISKGENRDGVNKAYVMDVSQLDSVDITARFQIGRFQFTKKSKGDVNLSDLSYWLMDKASASKTELVGNSIPLLKDGKVFGIVTLNSVNNATLHLSAKNERGQVIKEPLLWAYDVEAQTLLFKNETRKFALIDLKLKAIDELSQHIEVATWYSSDADLSGVSVAKFVGFKTENHQYSVFVSDELLLEMNLPESMNINGKTLKPQLFNSENAQILTFKYGNNRYYLSHIIQTNTDEFSALVIEKGENGEFMRLLKEVNM